MPHGGEGRGELLETPFGEYAVEPAAACCPSPTSWPRHAARGRRRCI